MKGAFIACMLIFTAACLPGSAVGQSTDAKADCPDDCVPGTRPNGSFFWDCVPGSAGYDCQEQEEGGCSMQNCGSFAVLDAAGAFRQLQLCPDELFALQEHSDGNSDRLVTQALRSHALGVAQPRS